MEIKDVFAGLGILTAFGCGLALSVSWIARSRIKSKRLTWRLRNGISWAKPPASFLLRSCYFSRMAQRAVWNMHVHGVQTTEEALVSLFIAVTLLVVCFLSFILGSFIGAIAITACFFAVLVARLNFVWDARRETMREAVPDILRSMETCFQAGLSLSQTFQQISQEASGFLQIMFTRAVHQMETGCSVRAALATLRDSSELPELSFIAVALDVQHQSGGSMQKVLETARVTVESKLELRRSLHVQTAQAKISAQVVSVMPLVLIAVFSLLEPGFLMPFFSSFAGFVLLGIAGGMQITGIFIVRRLLAVNVDS